MNKLILNNGIRFVVLFFFQLFVLNNIRLSMYVVAPPLYILFILMLPIHMPVSVAMLFAMLMGISVDMISDSGGIHAAAAVFMAFVRPLVLKIFNPPGGYEGEIQINIKEFGFVWVLIVASVITFIHHFCVFFLDAFTFNDFFFTIARVLATSVITVFMIMVYQILVFSKK